MAKASSLQTGHVYRFPVGSSNEFVFVRVVLHAAQLELSFGNSLFFIANDYLFQVSKLNELHSETFHESNLLVNGVFVEGHRFWAKQGFVKVGEQAITMDEVEMPCFGLSSGDGKGGMTHSICRGEVRCPLKDGKTPDQIGCYLCKKNLENLKRDIIVKGNERVLHKHFWCCDGRFSENCRSLMQESGIDLAIRYCRIIPKERLPVYQNAIGSYRKS